MKKAPIKNPTFLAVSGIVAVVLIVIFANWLVQSTSLGNRNIDLTEDKRHTLTDGTISILTELESPVIIRFYATRKSELMPRRLKNYMRKVDDLLNRYSQLSKGKIRIEHLDPQPDTDAEDSANLDGIFGQRVNEENLYFGVSLSCLDQKSNIPLLDPNDETMLEYHLSSAIANISTFEKPTIGLMTALPLAGVAPSDQMMMGMQPPQAQEPWIIYQLLQQRYQIADLGINPTEIDPEKTPILLLIHPAGITAETEFLIDQYLLQGGIVIACLDPFALTAPSGPDILGTAGGTQRVSTFTYLLNTWGVGMDSTAVVGDGKYAMDFKNSAGGDRMYAHLSLSTEALSSTDEIITQGFENIYFPLAGGLTLNQEVEGISVETLVESSPHVILMASEEAQKASPHLFAQKLSESEPYSLVMRLKGVFPTAFPNGAPGAEDTTEDNALKRSIVSSSVYLISDADFIFDRACFVANQQGYIAVNNNAALLQNILDQCTGSKHLIGSRSRAASTRPFTIIKEMETAFEQELQADVAKARTDMEGIISELQDLQTQKTQSSTLVLSPEQELKITELQEKQVRLSRELREKQKGLQARKDLLYSKITWMTVAISPTFIALSGIGIWLRRRRTTRTK
ncbi:MAG: Gldg family protein [Akkermansiaceae bacterium]